MTAAIFTAIRRRPRTRPTGRGFPARRRAAKKRNKLAGIGLANYVETPVGAPIEWVDGQGAAAKAGVEVAVGTQSSGQGHETTFAQVMADRLGVTPEEVKLITGDTKIVAAGGGTHSDRSMRMAGKVHGRCVRQDRGAGAQGVCGAGRRARKRRDVRRRPVLDAALEPPARHVRHRARHRRRTHRCRRSCASRSRSEAKFVGRIPAYPTGTAVCEVEIDPDTGVVDIVRYTSVDDAGQVINPMVLHGQTHGGIVQGAGQALMEAVVHDPTAGQVLSASFMDYAMLRADQVPSFYVDLVEDPTHGNPLRIKGGGEAGITPALATIMNAVVDALSVYGIEHLEMPATPARVWAAIDRAVKTKRRNEPK